MKKRLISLVLIIVIAATIVPSASAANEEATEAADTLNSYGLFLGTGVDAYGNLTYGLDRYTSREEAVTMLVRLLGKEYEATSEMWNTPFSDVSVWAQGYVGYAYNNKLTYGTSETLFGGKQYITASQYITLVLRALGYTSGVDFAWDKAWELSDRIGLTSGEYTATNNYSFTRGDLAIISRNALNTKVRDGIDTLKTVLINSGAIVEPGIRIDASIIENHRIMSSWIEINGKYYKQYSPVHGTYFDSDQTKYGLLFSGIYYDNNDQSQVYSDIVSLIAFMTISFGNYTIRPTDNPYSSGLIELQKPSTIQLEIDSVYISPNLKSDEYYLTYDNKTLELPDIENGNGVYIVNDLRYYVTKSFITININDALKYFGINADVSIETQDNYGTVIVINTK